MRKLEKPDRLERTKYVSLSESISEPWYFTHY
jgi:hypothetical protein